MKSKPSSIAANVSRFLRTYWILLLIPGAACAAQQSMPSESVGNRSPSTAKQMQIARPMEGHEAQGRGAPWIGISSDDSGSSAASMQSRTNSAGNALHVSGWWTIEVKNRDGSVAEHREFENALYNEGTQLLAYLLAGVVTAGEPMLELLSASGTSPCPVGLSDSACHIFVNPNGYWNQTVNPLCGDGPYCYGGGSTICLGPDGKPLSSLCSTTLVRTLQVQPNSALTLTLTGNIVAARDGDIDVVASYMMGCTLTDSTPSSSSPFSGSNPQQCSVPNYTPQANYSATEFPFTGTSISPINVSAGQTIQASVTFSFY